MAGIGHNSGDHEEDILSGAAQRQLKSLIERIERAEEEKDEVAEVIKEIYAEAKGNGYDVKVLRKVVRLRKMDPAKRAEEEAVLDLYMAATGDIPAFEPVAAPKKAKAEKPAEDEDDDPHGIG